MDQASVQLDEQITTRVYAATRHAVKHPPDLQPSVTDRNTAFTITDISARYHSRPDLRTR
jgi:hypothetical protein